MRYIYIYIYATEGEYYSLLQKKSPSTQVEIVHLFTGTLYGFFRPSFPRADVEFGKIDKLIFTYVTYKKE